MTGVNEFLDAKQTLLNRLLNESITNDLEYEVATFVNSLHPYYFYVMKGEEYYFFSVFAECFLDQLAYENRREYVRLILMIVPEELKREILECIRKSSVVYQYFPLEYDFLESL